MQLPDEWFHNYNAILVQMYTFYIYVLIIFIMYDHQVNAVEFICTHNAYSVRRPRNIYMYYGAVAITLIDYNAI
jgi:hypothetical protein